MFKHSFLNVKNITFPSSWHRKICRGTVGKHEYCAVLSPGKAQCVYVYVCMYVCVQAQWVLCVVGWGSSSGVCVKVGRYVRTCTGVGLMHTGNVCARNSVGCQCEGRASAAIRIPLLFCHIFCHTLKRNIMQLYWLASIRWRFNACAHIDRSKCKIFYWEATYLLLETGFICI